jgi:hypothetical protein
LRPGEEEAVAKSSSRRSLVSPGRGKAEVVGSSSSSSSSPSRIPTGKQAGEGAGCDEQQEPRTLDDFLHQSSMPHNRKACTFQAQMQLPDGGLEKLTSFVQSTGRVRGLSLSQNNISDSGVKVSLRSQFDAVNKVQERRPLL